MGFKAMVAADRSKIFLAEEFFGTLATVEGKKIPVVIDNDQLKNRQGGQELAIADSMTLLYANTEDLPKNLAPGKNLNINGRECLIDDYSEAEGLSTVILREAVVV